MRKDKDGAINWWSEVTMFLEIIKDPTVYFYSLLILGDIYNEFRDSKNAYERYRHVYKHNESNLANFYDPDNVAKPI